MELPIRSRRTFGDDPLVLRPMTTPWRCPKDRNCSAKISQSRPLAIAEMAETASVSASGQARAAGPSTS
jgi:hypothetical protein